MAGKYSCWDIWVYLFYSDSNSLCDRGQTMYNPWIPEYVLPFIKTQPLLEIVWIQWSLFYLCHDPSWVSDEIQGHENVIHIHTQ